MGAPEIGPDRLLVMPMPPVSRTLVTVTTTGSPSPICTCSGRMSAEPPAVADDGLGDGAGDSGRDAADGGAHRLAVGDRERHVLVDTCIRAVDVHGEGGVGAGDIAVEPFGDGEPAEDRVLVIVTSISASVSVTVTGFGSMPVNVQPSGRSVSVIGARRRRWGCRRRWRWCRRRRRDPHGQVGVVLVAGAVEVDGEVLRCPGDRPDRLLDDVEPAGLAPVGDRGHGWCAGRSPMTTGLGAMSTSSQPSGGASSVMVQVEPLAIPSITAKPAPRSPTSRFTVSLNPSEQSTSTAKSVLGAQGGTLGDLLDDQGALHPGVGDGDLGRLRADRHRPDPG